MGKCVEGYVAWLNRQGFTPATRLMAYLYFITDAQGRVFVSYDTLVKRLSLRDLSYADVERLLKQEGVDFIREKNNFGTEQDGFRLPDAPRAQDARTPDAKVSRTPGEQDGRTEEQKRGPRLEAPAGGPDGTLPPCAPVEGSDGRLPSDARTVKPDRQRLLDAVRAIPGGEAAVKDALAAQKNGSASHAQSSVAAAFGAAFKAAETGVLDDGDVRYLDEAIRRELAPKPKWRMPDDVRALIESERESDAHGPEPAR